MCFSAKISHALDLLFFFFNDTATTEIYTLSLHDALPICRLIDVDVGRDLEHGVVERGALRAEQLFHHRHRALVVDRKSTRLNSSHANISYAVFCLKKKKKN